MIGALSAGRGDDPLIPRVPAPDAYQLLPAGDGPRRGGGHKTRTKSGAPRKAPRGGGKGEVAKEATNPPAPPGTPPPRRSPPLAPRRRSRPAHRAVHARDRDLQR